MIKPGTICIVVTAGWLWRDAIGRICTVTGPLVEFSVGDWFYPIDWQEPKLQYEYAAPTCLRPLNDPDSIVDERNREGITA